MVVRCLPTPHHTHSFFLYILKRFCNHPSHGIMQSIVLENPLQVCLQKPYCFVHKCSQSAVKQILSVNVSFSFWWSGWGLALALTTISWAPSFWICPWHPQLHKQTKMKKAEENICACTGSKLNAGLKLMQVLFNP